MPKVSVVVPVYNAEDYIQRCIDSIMNQSFRDFELILVNDGSKDGSLSICERYADRDERIVLVNKENEGVAASRNVGILNACGEWVTFVDADDYVEADFLERLYTDENVDMVIGGAQYIHKKYHFSPQRRFVNVVNNADVVDSQLCEIYFMTPWAKLFRRKVLEDNALLFNKDLRIGEDTDFVLRFLHKANTLLFVESNSYCYNDNAVGYGKYALDTRQYSRHTSVIFGSLGLLVDRCGYDFPKADGLLKDYYSRLYWTFIERIASYEGLLEEAGCMKACSCKVYPDSLKKKIVFRLMRSIPMLAYLCILLNRKRADA